MRKQRHQEFPVRGLHIVRDASPYQPFQGGSQDFRQFLIGVQDVPVQSQDTGALVHGLYKNAVGVICAFEGIDLLARGPGDHQGVHFAFPDGPQGVLRLFEAVAEVGDFG